MTLTLHKSHTQFMVGTSKKRPPGDSHRAHRCEIAQGTEVELEVPHDGPAKLPARLDAGRHKGVTDVQMACTRPVHAPVTHSHSCVFRSGGGGDVGRAARMNHGDIQQGGSSERSPQCRLSPIDDQSLQHQRECDWAPYAQKIRCHVGKDATISN
jgi:hypothetical protein